MRYLTFSLRLDNSLLGLSPYSIAALPKSVFSGPGVTSPKAEAKSEVKLALVDAKGKEVDVTPGRISVSLKGPSGEVRALYLWHLLSMIRSE